MEEEKIDKNHPKYYETFKWDIPDNETAADYIDGTHTGFQDKKIPELVDKIRNGEIPEDIMSCLRVLALNAHNGYIRYYLEKSLRFRAERNFNELRGMLIETLDELIELQGKTTQILRNVRDKIQTFWIDKPYERNGDE